MKNEGLKYYLTGVIILAVLGTSLEGCASPAQRKSEAAKALQEKYQENFEIVSYKEADPFTDYYTVQAYSVEYPDLLFEATIETDSGEIADEYVTKRLCDRLSEKISQNLGTLETDYYVFTEAMLGGTVITDPMVSLEDYMKEGPGNRFIVYLCLDEKDAGLQNITSSLIHMLDGIPEINGSLSMYLMNADLLPQVQEYVTSHDNIYEDFQELTEAAYIGYLDFENGKMSVTENIIRDMAGDRL